METSAPECPCHLPPALTAWGDTQACARPLSPGLSTSAAGGPGSQPGLLPALRTHATSRVRKLRLRDADGFPRPPGAPALGLPRAHLSLGAGP